MREIIHINNNWLYKPDFQKQYIDAFPSELEQFEQIRLPHTNLELPYGNFNEQDYQFISTYIHLLTVNKSWQGQHLMLNFEGVMLACEVFINGHSAGKHYGGYTPFKVDITPFILWDKQNYIVVKVDSTERADIPPFGHVVDFLTFGGIYREVQLEILPEIFVKDIFVKPYNTLKEHKSVKVDVDLAAFSQTTSFEEIELTAVLTDAGNQKIKIAEITSSANSSGITEMDLFKLDVENWSLEHPRLYSMQIIISRNKLILDTAAVRFGFRTAEFTKRGFFLNGKPLKIRGLNRHQSFPYQGYAMPERIQRRDAEILKSELGVNTVRESHYPQSRHFLDSCDELGILVFSEMPGWQHIGDKEWQANALQSVREMVLRDRNRPSVIIWGVRINESSDSSEFYKESNNIARDLDPTRQTGGVRNFAGSEFFEDVYTYNDFVHSGSNRGAVLPKKISKKSVPYLVTEHNGHMLPTKKVDPQERRVQQALRHVTVLNDVYAGSNHSGAIGWCMFDYNTHKDFGSGDAICHHGVMDMFRIPKYAAWAYRSQDSSRPFGKIASDLQFGDYNEGMFGEVWVFTNSEKVKVFKNDLFVGDFYPDITRFSHLPHPPVLIDDFLGDSIFENESFSKKDADIIKSYFLTVSKGKKASILLLLKLGIFMLKNKVKYRDGYDLYGKYMINWGSESTIYRFEGYSNNKKEWECVKSAAPATAITLEPDDIILHETETWDSTRCVVTLLTEHGQCAPYSFLPVTISINGSLELIGPSILSLQAGSTAFWVRTTGRTGSAEVTVSADGFGKQSVIITVE